MTSLRVNTIESPASAPEIDRPSSAPAIDRASSAPDDGFSEALESAVKKVDDLQLAADSEAQKLANGDGNLHETMLALEKADVAMRVAMKVRTKLVEAYNDVMRMTV